MESLLKSLNGSANFLEISMRWFLGVIIFIALANVALAVLMWADISIINDNLFLVYGQCVPGQDT